MQKEEPFSLIGPLKEKEESEAPDNYKKDHRWQYHKVGNKAGCLRVFPDTRLHRPRSLSFSEQIVSTSEIVFAESTAHFHPAIWNGNRVTCISTTANQHSVSYVMWIA
jgi:hypothetical protein